MDLLMRRYILEVEEDSRLIKLYGNGWYPNIDKYRLFIHKQEKNNEDFSKTIKKYNLIRKNDILYETVFSTEISNISSFFNNESVLYTSGYGSIHFDKSIIKMSKNGCYISNGIFEDTLSTCLNAVDKNSFIIGVCDNPDSIFYKENIKLLKEFKTLLNNDGISYQEYKHSNHRDKCYMLVHRS